MSVDWVWDPVHETWVVFPAEDQSRSDEQFLEALKAKGWP